MCKNNHIVAFRLLLKEFNVSQSFTDCGRLFHSLGAEHGNASL